MKKIKYYLIALLLIGTAHISTTSLAQEESAPNPPLSEADSTADGAEPLPEKSSNRRSKYKPEPQGIRFVFKEVPEGVKKTIYMPINKKEGAEIDVMIGLLTKRIPFPKGGKVELYMDPPVEGKYEGRKLLVSPLPSGSLDRLIGVIVPAGEDCGIFFLNESELKPGTVCMKNLTNQPIRISINDKDFFVFNPGEEKIYGSSNGKSATHMAKMYFQDKNNNWYVGRQFAMKSRQRDAELHLFIWNPHIQKVDLQKIIVAPEYDRTPKPVLPKDRLPKPPRGATKGGPIPWDTRA